MRMHTRIQPIQGAWARKPISVKLLFKRKHVVALPLLFPEWSDFTEAPFNKKRYKYEKFYTLWIRDFMEKLGSKSLETNHAFLNWNILRNGNFSKNHTSAIQTLVHEISNQFDCYSPKLKLCYEFWPHSSTGTCSKAPTPSITSATKILMHENNKFGCYSLTLLWILSKFSCINLVVII